MDAFLWYHYRHSIVVTAILTNFWKLILLALLSFQINSIWNDLKKNNFINLKSIIFFYRKWKHFVTNVITEHWHQVTWWHNVPRLWPTQILLHSIVIKFDLAHNNFSRHILAMLGTVLSNHPFCWFLKKERQLQAEYLNSITTDNWFIHGSSLILKKNPVPSLQILGAELAKLGAKFDSCRI